MAVYLLQKKQLFYYFGRFFKKINFFNRKVSYNLKVVPNTSIFQIDYGISVIKRYYDEKSCCEFYTLNELIGLTEKLYRIKNIGVLLHHRYHNSKEKIALIYSYLNWCKALSNVEFLNQQSIYKRFSSF